MSALGPMTAIFFNPVASGSVLLFLSRTIDSCAAFRAKAACSGEPATAWIGASWVAAAGVYYRLVARRGARAAGPAPSRPV